MVCIYAEGSLCTVFMIGALQEQNDLCLCYHYCDAGIIYLDQAMLYCITVEFTPSHVDSIYVSVSSPLMENAVQLV